MEHSPLIHNLVDSFDAISCSDADLSDDDEVVWELSSSFASLVAHESADEHDDFVLLNKPCSASTEPRPADETLPQSPVSPTASATPIPTVTASINAAPARRTTQTLPPTPASRSRKDGRQLKKEAAGSEDAEQAKKERKRAARRRRKQHKKLRKQQAEKQASMKELKSTGANEYQEASLFISTFLANPVAKRDSVCRLVLLQSLIVELGLTPREPSEFPTTIRAARKFVKTRVFLNVKEYIAHREEGQAALQRLLYPSKTALIKDIRRKGNRASLKWVKEQGLEVLLVSCYHH